ncbi:cilia and flagella associated protein 20 [Rhinolophus ferrumequinum]|uniref:Cilia and flagella associated protein 20 n=1 Tax=Rhinolophus ferrumequinum TaxID=59479 RepID=A0A7J7SH18_RHIFE|nr:cilia and flagella associated protein 20 [Rhinolophus ferrumequinum]
MFKNTFQSGFLSILYSIGSKPLQIWDKKVRNGHIKRITDNDIQSLVLEIEGTNVSTTYITCPADPKKTLGIKLPFLVMIIKNLKKYFTFEVQVLDDKNVRRRFRASNYQSTTRVKPFICTMPMRLDDGWNQIQFNLSDFTRRAYGTNYIETLRVQVPGAFSTRCPKWERGYCLLLACVPYERTLWLSGSSSQVTVLWALTSGGSRTDSGFSLEMVGEYGKQTLPLVRMSPLSESPQATPRRRKRDEALTAPWRRRGALGQSGNEEGQSCLVS